MAVVKNELFTRREVDKQRLLPASCGKIGRPGLIPPEDEVQLSAAQQADLSQTIGEVPARAGASLLYLASLLDEPA